MDNEFQIKKSNLIKRLQDVGLEAFDAGIELRVIIEKVTGKKDFYDNSLTFTKAQLAQIDEILEKRANNIPLQYIFNEAYFFGEKYYVNENTLIPRPETELLVEHCINLVKNKKKCRILDIGTGSGCIAITLAKTFPDFEIISCDISDKALHVAQKNAKELNANVEFVLSDIFENIQGKFDLIVSNPPYIPIQSKSTLQKEVLMEPELALFTIDEFGLEFYQKIIKDSKNFLLPKSILIFELQIGQSEKVKKLFKENNYQNINIMQDYNKIDRIISAVCV